MGLKGMIPVKWKRKLREILLAIKIRHISGPKQVRLKDNEAAVTCIVKNYVSK